MKKKHKPVLGVALIALGFLAGSVDAAILWQWSFGTEAGTVLTEGDLVGGAAPAGTYNVTNFSVTQSGIGLPLGSITEGQWNEGSQPGTGFVWDGSSDTQWFRGSDPGPPLTNGTNYYPSGSAGSDFDRVLFFPGTYRADFNGSSASGTSLNLAPNAVPEPSAGLLFGLGALGLAFGRKRR